MLRRVFRPRNFAIVGISTFGLGLAAQHNENVSHLGIVRYTRAEMTAFKTILDYKITMRGDKESDEYKNNMHLCHLRGAHRILDLCKANGGVFIKVGQHVASLQYLIPEEYVNVLSILHAKAPESDIDEIKKLFEQTTGKKIHEVFSEFDPNPVGAASLAQVHQARLLDGTKVAVKIQHPKVKSRAKVDLVTMEFFTRIADKLFPEFKLMWLVDETKKNLPKELDFLHEADNAEKVREMFKHLKFLKIPKIYRELCSEKVLTMEFCEGRQITDVDYFKENNMNTHDICRQIGHLYSEMIFKEGFIHCDPHPGNVLVQKDKNNRTKLVLLDHGLYSTLDNEFRVDYCNLWMALLNADKDEIKRVCEKMNIPEFGLFACIVTARSWESVSQGITKVKSSAQEVNHIKDFAASLIPQISQVLDKMPRSMLLILKTNDLLRAIEHRLGAQNRSDAFVEMTRQCTRAVFQHQINHSNSFVSKFRITFKLYISLATIYIYQIYLCLREWTMGNHLLPSTSQPLTVVP